VSAPAQGPSAASVTWRPALPTPPPSLLARLRLGLLGLSFEELLAEARGFRVSGPEAAEHQARIAAAFWLGYHGSLADPRPEPIVRTVEDVERGWRGYAWEGVGMVLAMLGAFDLRLGSRRRAAGRLGALLAGRSRGVRYLVYLGVGAALARFRLPTRRLLAALDPLCRWLVFDGFGFHEGFFAPAKTLGVVPMAVPPRLRGYARRAFDQGLGRSLWFVHGMDAEAIEAAVGTFHEARRGDLWAGVGLASAYAGGAPPRGLPELARRAGRWRPDLLQGVAFAATARVEGDDLSAHTDEACRTYYGAGAAELAALCRDAARGLPDDGHRLDLPEPAWEVWRRRVRSALAAGNSRPLR
jgi:hypothetical protein